MQKDIPEQYRLFCDQVEAHCQSTLEKYTLLILTIQGENIRHEGTAVLLQIADVPFLLTAAHVIDEMNKLKNPAYLSSGQDLPIIPFGTRSLFSSSVSKKNKDYDPFD